MPTPRHTTLSQVGPIWDQDTLITTDHSHQLIDATNDAQAILEWLDKYRDNANTLGAARKDAERFYLWMKTHDLTINTLKKKHCEDYQRFLKDPQPAEEWCGPPKPRFLKDGSTNPQWKPFVGPLKDSSVKQSRTNLYGLFEFLVHAGYSKGNPWRLLGRSRGAQQQTDLVERFLDKDDQAFLKQYIESMQHGNQYEQKHYARTRWIFALLYVTAARRSEFVSAKMNDFRNINGDWWWRVVGKGNVVGDIPVTQELLVELSRYRLSLGLPVLPSPAESHPLISDVFGKMRPITSSALYKIVKQVLSNASDLATTAGNQQSATNLVAASTHWMRHTSATDQVNAPGANLIAVSKNLRHKNLSTTSIYSHASRKERHKQTEAHVMWNYEVISKNI